MALLVPSQVPSQAILSYIAESSLDINRLLGFASDGTAVMVGCHNAEATQLKRICPTLISIHCVSSQQRALAASTAVDRNPYLQRFQTHLHNLFAFYQNSPDKMAGLHAFQSLLIK